MTLEAKEVAACTKLLALSPSDRLVVLDYLLALKKELASAVQLLYPLSLIGFNAHQSWPDHTPVAEQWTTGFGKITVGDCRAAGRAVKKHQVGEHKT